MDDQPDLPTTHEIQAACWTAALLQAPETTIAAARASYRNTPTGGRFSEDDLLRGEQLLVASGLITVNAETLEVTELAAELPALDDEVACYLLVGYLLARRPPLWLRSAAGGAEVKPELIPDRANSQLVTLLGDEQRGRALLLTAARRHDAARIAGIAALGENAVEDLCRRELEDSGYPQLAERVRRIQTPALGYSVTAPTRCGSVRRMAVRTTRRTGWRGELHLTRDEIVVGRADPDWALVVCELDGAAVSVAGWCRAAALGGLLPVDAHAHGRWLNTSLLLLDQVLTPGLPPL